MTHDYDLVYVGLLQNTCRCSRHEDGYVRNVDALPMNCLVLVAILIASRFGCPKKVCLIRCVYKNATG